MLCISERGQGNAVESITGFAVKESGKPSKSGYLCFVTNIFHKTVTCKLDGRLLRVRTFFRISQTKLIKAIFIPCNKLRNILTAKKRRVQ